MSCKWVLTKHKLTTENVSIWTALKQESTAFYSNGGCVREDGTGYIPVASAAQERYTIVSIGKKRAGVTEAQSKTYKLLLNNAEASAEIRRRINNTVTTTGFTEARAALDPEVKQLIEQYLSDRQNYIDILSELGVPQHRYKPDLSMPADITNYIGANKESQKNISILKYEGFGEPVLFNGFPNCGYTYYNSNDFADTNVFLSLYITFDPGKLMSIKEAYEDYHFRQMIKSGVELDKIPPADFSGYRQEINLGTYGIIFYNPFALTEEDKQLVGLSINQIKSKKRRNRAWQIDITTPSYESLMESGVSSLQLGDMGGESQLAECPDPKFVVRPDGIINYLTYHYSDGTSQLVQE